MAALGTRTLVISIGATDYTNQMSKAVITSGESDSDFVSFADAASGGAREYRLEFTAVQDLVAATLWDLIFTGAGTTVAYLLKPYGNATATPSQPHFSGNAIVTEPDGDFLGGEADSSATAKMLVEPSWVCTGKPVRIVA